MRELIQKSLRLWQRAERPGASSEDTARAVAAIPELCDALDAALLRVREAGAGGSSRRAPRSEGDLDRFSRYLAHEVRNRLNLVELSVERATVLSGDPRVRSALEPVHRAFRHLAAIADDLRAATFSSPGSPAAARAEVPRLPLRSVVEDILAVGRNVAEAEGVALDLDGGCPDVEVDAARLELVLVNLLTNSLRHADGGKDERWVRVEARWADGEEGVLELCVRDNGKGVPAHLRESLFEDPGRAPSGGPPRNGMGLAIVRQAVERAGGCVWLESDEGVGTAVHFTLPVPRDGAEPRKAEPPRPPRRQSADAP